MTDLSWQRGPLGEEVERYLGEQAPGSGWTRALGNWDRLNLVFSDVAHRTIFQSELSVSQVNSYRLLLEWWTGQCQDQDASAAVRAAIVSCAQGPSADQRTPPNLDLHGSRYNTQLWELFQYEFFFYGKSTNAPIQLRRHTAASIAACQRLAYLTYKTSSPGSRGGLSILTPAQIHIAMPADIDQLAQISRHCFGNLIGAIIEPCPWLPSTKKSGLPYYLWDIERQCSVVVHELQKQPQYAIVSHTWGRWLVPDSHIVLPGVPWKIPRNTRFEVERLPDILLQNISAFAPNRYLWLDLLCIPQDRSQLASTEIARQAAIFGGAMTAIAWLNNIDSWKGIQAGIQWLALAFLRGQHSPDNDIDTLLSEVAKRCVSSTQLFEAYHHTNTNLSLGENPCGWFTSLWTLQEACLRPEMQLFNRNWEPLVINESDSPVPITLDSLLALVNYFTKHLSPGLHNAMPPAVIEIAALNTHTSLDHLLQYSPLAVLILADRRECLERRAEAVMSVMDATDWYVKTADHSLLEENLVLGKYPIEFLREIRQNLGAEFFASMYAECCFWDVFQPRKKEEPIILEDKGVRDEDGDEVHDDEGENNDDDWVDTDSAPSEIKDSVEKEDEEILTPSPAGTLLPFGLSTADSKFALSATGPDRLDHPAVSTWTLLSTGAVHIPSAGIVASTDSQFSSSSTGTDPALIATVFGPLSPAEPRRIGLKNNPDGEPGPVDLHEWVRESDAMWPGLAKHAVCLKYSTSSAWSQGVILMQVDENEEVDGEKRDAGKRGRRRRRYAKLGDYYTNAVDANAEKKASGKYPYPRVAPTWNVDWEVL